MFGQSRKFAQKVPRDSPLSLLLYCRATASLPRAIKAACPEALVNKFADDLTLQISDTKPEAAAQRIQRGLDALGSWAEQNYVTFSLEETKALEILIDLKEMKGKSKPRLHSRGEPIQYNEQKPSLTILGVTIDSQLRFTEQAKEAKKKLSSRNIIKALLVPQCPKLASERQTNLWG